VSIKKEDERKKPGDEFAATKKTAKKACKLELPSWGDSIYLAKSKKTLFVVRQSDTDYSELSWVDPTACKIVSTLREFGSVTLTSTSASFSGGEDGPAKIPGKTFKLGNDCLPVKLK
jgi:hypothetical protein